MQFCESKASTPLLENGFLSKKNHRNQYFCDVASGPLDYTEVCVTVINRPWLFRCVQNLSMWSDMHKFSAFYTVLLSV